METPQVRGFACMLGPRRPTHSSNRVAQLPNLLELAPSFEFEFEFRPGALGYYCHPFPVSQPSYALLALPQPSGALGLAFMVVPPILFHFPFTLQLPSISAHTLPSKYIHSV